MAEIKEVFEDIKDTLGDNGFMIFIGGALLFGLYNLAKSSNSEDKVMYTATGYSSYPDSVTNANVIIDTLQNSIDYSQIETSEKIQGLEDNMTEFIGDNFEATNDYINSGFESQNQLLLENFDNIFYGVEGLENSLESISETTDSILQSQDKMSKDMYAYYKNLNNTTNQILNEQRQYATENRQLSQQNLSALQQFYNKLQTSSSSGSSGSSGSSAVSKTFSATPYTGVSIVDGLKAIGVNSSYSYRKRIAQANGISGYRGSSSQNLEMLSKLKAGTLVNPD